MRGRRRQMQSQALTLHDSPRAHARGEKLINSMKFRLRPTNLLQELHLSTDLCTGFVDNPEL